MRTLSAISAAVFLLLLPVLSLAQNPDDCRLKCAATKDTNNTTCPAAEADADSAQARAQCLKNNENAYYDCVMACPAPPASANPSGGETQPPVPMGY